MLRGRRPGTAADPDFWCADGLEDVAHHEDDGDDVPPLTDITTDSDTEAGE